jgi:2-polyprenyl-3-methyl-5-hydroxy-6-metoxy-1,4-benzoquinol methylase
MNEYDRDGFWSTIDDGGEFKIEILGDFARKLVLKLVNPKPGQRILDMGCGTGRMARECARNGAEVVAVDRGEDVLSLAKSFEMKKPLGIRYLKADMTTNSELDIEAICPDFRPFDTIFSSCALMHNDPWSQSRALYKWSQLLLKREGMIIISIVPHVEMLNAVRAWKSAVIEYDTHAYPYDVVVVGARPVTEKYRSGRRPELVFESEVYILREEFYQLALRAALGPETKIVFHYVTITSDMLESCGFSRIDPIVGVKGYTIMTATR